MWCHAQPTFDMNPNDMVKSTCIWMLTCKKKKILSPVSSREVYSLLHKRAPFNMSKNTKIFNMPISWSFVTMSTPQALSVWLKTAEQTGSDCPNSSGHVLYCDWRYLEVEGSWRKLKISHGIGLEHDHYLSPWDALWMQPNVEDCVSFWPWQRELANISKNISKNISRPSKGVKQSGSLTVGGKLSCSHHTCTPEHRSSWSLALHAFRQNFLKYPKISCACVQTSRLGAPRLHCALSGALLGPAKGPTLGMWKRHQKLLGFFSSTKCLSADNKSVMVKLSSFPCDAAQIKGLHLGSIAKIQIAKLIESKKLTKFMESKNLSGFQCLIKPCLQMFNVWLDQYCSKNLCVTVLGEPAAVDLHNRDSHPVCHKKSSLCEPEMANHMSANIWHVAHGLFRMDSWNQGCLWPPGWFFYLLAPPFKSNSWEYNRNCDLNIFKLFSADNPEDPCIQHAVLFDEFFGSLCVIPHIWQNVNDFNSAKVWCLMQAASRSGSRVPSLAREFQKAAAFGACRKLRGYASATCQRNLVDCKEQRNTPKAKQITPVNEICSHLLACEKSKVPKWKRSQKVLETKVQHCLHQGTACSPSASSSSASTRGSYFASTIKCWQQSILHCVTALYPAQSTHHLSLR